jgi:hypothetical protein
MRQRSRLPVRAVIVGLLCLSPLARPQQARAPLSIRVLPAKPYIETGDAQQFLNFDFWIENPASTKLRLHRVEASAFDARGDLQFRKLLVEDGDSPGILTIPELNLEPGGFLFIFNPFYALDASLGVDRIYYEFFFDAADSEKPVSVSANVYPGRYRTKTDLILPIQIRMIVYDGHDFYSHHRRVNLGRPETQKLGFRDNPVRFAYDLCVVNKRGALYAGDPSKKENWFGYGVPVYATGAGIVISAENGIDENEIVDAKLVYAKNMPETVPGYEGNHVTIDHGNGEYSHFAHLKPGSVLVRKGDLVRQGQMIGRMGFSGDSGFHVHLHYQLMDSSEISKVGGVPSYFRSFRRVVGSKLIDVAKGQIDTGDIVESVAKTEAGPAAQFQGPARPDGPEGHTPIR